MRVRECAVPTIKVDVTFDSVDLTRIGGGTQIPQAELATLSLRERRTRTKAEALEGVMACLRAYDEAGVHAHAPANTKKSLSQLASRNRFITGRDVTNLYDAIAFANCHYEKYLDRHFTIVWSEVDRGDHQAAVKLFSNLIKEFGQRVQKWRRGQGNPLLYVYAHENDRFRGFHTHLLVDLSPDEVRRARRWMRKWFTRQAGKAVPETLFKVRKPTEPERSYHRALRQWVFFRYLIKGIDPTNAFKEDGGTPEAFQKILHIRRLRESWPIYCGRRVGCCEALSRAKRDAENFKTPFSDETQSLTLIYQDLVSARMLERSLR